VVKVSFCRFAWDGSDVYVFESQSGIECCGCKLGTNFCTSEPEQMIVHLGQHRRAGHFVPEHAITGLWNYIPGATSPAEAQPDGMAKAGLLFQRALIDQRLQELEK